MKTLFMLVAVMMCTGCEVPNRNQTPPDVAARKFADDLKLDVAGVSCTQSDTDNDGYVTCTVSFDFGADTPPFLTTINCAPVGATTGGCKAKPEQMNAMMQAKVRMKHPNPATSAK